MGVSHATSGAAAGLLAAQLAPAALGVADTKQVFAFAVMGAGYALLPDLDHPDSLATRRFSAISGLACGVVRPLSRVAFRLTATCRDDPGRHEHRGLTHTGLAAVGLGVGANLAVVHWGAAAVWAIVFVGMALAVKGIDRLIPGPPSLFAGAALTWAALRPLPGEHHAPGVPLPWAQAGAGFVGPAWLGSVVTLGMLVHSLGDALTLHGAPVLWPLPLGGRTWYPVRPPRPFRLHTGKAGERVALVGFTAATLVLAAHAVPGLWPARTARHSLSQGQVSTSDASLPPGRPPDDQNDR